MGALSFFVAVTLPYHPHPGEVLICDFDDSAPGAEMVKRRPAVVVSRRDSHGRALATVVPLSTTAPLAPMAWHHCLPLLRIVGWKASGVVWAKCDMLATVSFSRLCKPYLKTRHGRSYTTHMLDANDLEAIRNGIRAYLNL